ncbi:MAG: hypothetical protein AAGH15_24100 [Myxococcota bacterium]
MTVAQDERLCGGKVKYGSRAKAKEVRRCLSARLRVYWCPRCAQWHLTNTDKRRRR